MGQFAVISFVIRYFALGQVNQRRFSLRRSILQYCNFTVSRFFVARIFRCWNFCLPWYFLALRIFAIGPCAVSFYGKKIRGNFWKSHFDIVQTCVLFSDQNRNIQCQTKYLSGKASKTCIRLRYELWLFYCPLNEVKKYSYPISNKPYHYGAVQPIWQFLQSF